MKPWCFKAPGELQEPESWENPTCGEVRPGNSVESGASGTIRE